MTDKKLKKKQEAAQAAAYDLFNTLTRLGVWQAHLVVGQPITGEFEELTLVGMQEAALLRRVRLLAGDEQNAVFHFHIEVGFGETGNRHGDAVGVLFHLLNIVGRVAVCLVHTGCGLEHALHAVKTDGRTV